MPATPYAKLLVSVNGGGPTSGGIDIPSAASIQFSFESTVGWTRARIEISDYPEGWATPAGWTLRADGTIYWDWTGMNPSAITFPDNGVLWGVWMPRLLVNEQLDDDQNIIGDLLDSTTALSLLSPEGLRDIGAREEDHFTTVTTRIKKWIRSYQRNLRAVQSPAIVVSTTNTSPTRLRRFPIADGTVRAIRAIVVCYNTGGAKHAEYEVKALFKRVSGTLALASPGSLAAAVTTVFETDAGLNVTLTLNGNTDVDLNAVGLGENFTWRVSEFFL
jgi:hypothetical protein